MEIREQLEITGTVEQVLAALADPAYHAFRAERNGALGHETDVQRTPEGLVVTTRWELPAQELPPAARAMVGQSLPLREVQRWNATADGAHGTLEGRFERVDLAVDATMRLSPAGAVCRQLVEGRVTSSVPFLGRQVVAAATPVLVQALRTEAATASAWIGSR